MKIDVLVFSRNRNEILQKSIATWKNDPFDYFIFHNSEVPIHLSKEINIKYIHCPGMSYSERADIAQHWIKSDYAVILADDERLVAKSVLELIDFLQRNDQKISIAGRVVGVHKYVGNLITGSFAYRNMWNYSCEFSDPLDRLEKHLQIPINGGLPIGGLYRIMPKPTMRLVLKTFGMLNEVSTPYIFEVIAEVITAFSGPLVNSDPIYWIRNWQEEMITHSKWDRKLNFSLWWKSQEYKDEKKAAISILSEVTKIPEAKLSAILNSYVKRRNSIENTSNRKLNPFKEKLAIIKRLAIKRLNQKRMPSDLRTILTRHENRVKEQDLHEVLRLSHELLID